MLLLSEILFVFTYGMGEDKCKIWREDIKFKISSVKFLYIFYVSKYNFKSTSVAQGGIQGS